MAIPAFNSNLTLPPHLGSPTRPQDISPFQCTSKELCERFATSPERIRILQGLLRLRSELRKHGVFNAFQWLDGSFLEDIEHSEKRAPRDIDVVTWYWDTDPNFSVRLASAFPDICNNKKIKTDFFVDHYPVDIGFRPDIIVSFASYWCGLFSHTRSQIWKGMLRVDLNTPIDDNEAGAVLASKVSSIPAIPITVKP